MAGRMMLVAMAMVAIVCFSAGELLAAGLVLLATGLMFRRLGGW